MFKNKKKPPVEVVWDKVEESINKGKEIISVRNFMTGNGIKIVKELGDWILVLRIRIRLVETEIYNNK